MAQIIAGIHAVKHALESGETIDELIIERGKGHPRLNELIHLAKSQGIRVSFQPRQVLERLAGGVPHQGAVARVVRGKRPDFSDWLAGLDTNGNPVILLLDGVTDPHNLGACVRTAEAAGCVAVIIPRDHAADVESPVAAKAACGALSRLPVFSVTNLVRAMQALQDNGFWLVGLAGEAEKSIYATELGGRLGVVMGAEGKGLRRLVCEQCDELLSIPMTGNVESLNVSVATGVTLFEMLRQRLQADKPAGPD
jgi:23S rRNA (guanosine2251-2'-O)-methyltransferase